VASLKSLLKPIVPKSLLSAYRDYNLERMRRRSQKMTPREVFTDIYNNNRWGGTPGTFCSGSGSTTAGIVAPYVACIRRQLSALGAHSLSVVDLGCGDFSVGRQFADECSHYLGIDIVEGLIRHNNETFGTDRISFRCLNIIEDPLPGADICFVRQVLQHLSNEQIRGILPKLARYKWVFITEHHPSPAHLSQRNLNKPHGSDIRLRHSSGVFLDHPPFNIPPDRLELLLEVRGHAYPDEPDPGVIRTYLLRSTSTPPPEP
jgi:hypothetical protein